MKIRDLQAGQFALIKPYKNKSGTYGVFTNRVVYRCNDVVYLLYGDGTHYPLPNHGFWLDLELLLFEDVKI